MDGRKDVWAWAQERGRVIVFPYLGMNESSLTCLRCSGDMKEETPDKGDEGFINERFSCVKCKITVIKWL